MPCPREGLALPPGTYRAEISGERAAPADYTIGLRPSVYPIEGEPDDQPELARSLLPGVPLRGTLAEDNPAHIRFDVTLADNLWEMRGVQGLGDVALRDGNDHDFGAWRARDGALVLRLALPTGHYLGYLRGDGAYALRLSDLGPRPLSHRL